MQNTILAILFTTGALLAGSDGAWFPWVNIAGIGVFGLVAVISKKSKNEFLKPCGSRSMMTKVHGVQ